VGLGQRKGEEGTAPRVRTQLCTRRAKIQRGDHYITAPTETRAESSRRRLTKRVTNERYKGTSTPLGGEKSGGKGRCIQAERGRGISLFSHMCGGKGRKVLPRKRRANDHGRQRCVAARGAKRGTWLGTKGVCERGVAKTTTGRRELSQKSKRGEGWINP